MEIKESTTEQIRQIAGIVRLLAAVMRPGPHGPELNRTAFELALGRIAADLDRVAQRTERCQACCPIKFEGERP